MAEVAHAQPSWVLLAYLAAGVCFILALRGLSSPESSRRGNTTGMIGMAIAIATTLVVREIASLPEIIGAMVIGGGRGLAERNFLNQNRPRLPAPSEMVVDTIVSVREIFLTVSWSSAAIFLRVCST